MANAQKNIMLDFQMTEISGVDVPAQEGATALIMKRSDGTKGKGKGKGKPEDLEAVGGDKDKKNKKGDISKLSALTDGVNGHSHTVALLGPPDGVEMVAGDTSYEDGHSHPWIKTEGNQIMIGMATDRAGVPHTHAVAAVSKNQTTGLAGFEVGKTEEPNMADPIKNPEMEALQAQLAKSQKMASLTDGQKAYHKGLEDGAADAFLEMGDTERTDMAKAASDLAASAALDKDPVVYKTTAGLELRKSAGQAFIAMAMDNDNMRKRMDTTDKELAKNLLEKRAGDLLPNLPGTIEVRASMLKAVDGIEDKDHREAAMAGLKSQNDMLGKAQVTLGYGSNTVHKEGGSEATLDGLAKAFQKNNAGVTYEDAYTQVLDTPEGVKLYNETVN